MKKMMILVCSILVLGFITGCAVTDKVNRSRVKTGILGNNPEKLTEAAGDLKLQLTIL